MSEVTRFKKENTEKQLSNSEIKEHLLEMLVEFAEFCGMNMVQKSKKMKNVCVHMGIARIWFQSII